VAFISARTGCARQPQYASGPARPLGRSTFELPTLSERRRTACSWASPRSRSGQRQVSGMGAGSASGLFLLRRAGKFLWSRTPGRGNHPPQRCGRLWNSGQDPCVRPRVCATRCLGSMRCLREGSLAQEWAQSLGTLVLGGVAQSLSLSRVSPVAIQRCQPSRTRGEAFAARGACRVRWSRVRSKRPCSGQHPMACSVRGRRGITVLGWTWAPAHCARARRAYSTLRGASTVFCSVYTRRTLMEALGPPGAAWAPPSSRGHGLGLGGPDPGAVGTSSPMHPGHSQVSDRC
jgi:hypothetical protein